MNKLEECLTEKFNKKYCVFTGSGTTSIYLILKALNLNHKKIVYPAITCMTPVNAAIYAGYAPEFCDVNLEDYTMDIESLKSIIDNEDIGIIVPTHIYGHRCDMKSIYEIVRDKNIFILEDSAQSYYFSGYSDASIISFGNTKLLQCNNGGGAIFTDDVKLYNNILKYKKDLPRKPFDIENKFNLYRDSYYGIVRNYKGKEFNIHMKQLQLDSRETFIYDLVFNEALLDVINELENIIDKRKERRNLYDKYLIKKNLYLPKLEENEGLWRYTFLYKGNREKLLLQARKQGVDISNWYINLSKIHSDNQRILKNADIVENEVVNLWIEDKKKIEDIKKDIKIINDIIINNR
ncbi:DegT/DnrJ/EryC1/StrS family aminotransferase [Clostridium niameyense]|uniref:DegT/DnrJ/EryC1/StrS family aminotransferase n=1 Tax=Clostridium niameyense TaxID=1622073 RepID=UPI00067F329A|nr:DegT/DnrJ/EryC1/StrS family aminotransferase [Clostridium niameyense]